MKNTKRFIQAIMQSGCCLLALCAVNRLHASEFADVQQVTVSGEDMQYHFSVTIHSPDVGCEQYANWWEVLNADGTLLYRRILAHSHVSEQPFTRSGGVVAVTKHDKLYIRAHMNSSGYGGHVFVGSVVDGFKLADLETAQKVQLFTVEQPKTTCAF